MTTSMKFEDGEATLTTDHPASSHGVPVLIDPRWEGPRGAADWLLPDGDMTGEDYVSAFYRVGDRIPPLVRAFLGANPTPSAHTSALLAGKGAQS